MPYVITSRCQGHVHAACVEVCPVDAIHGPDRRSAESDPTAQLFIDPETCISCTLCGDTCPVNAPFEEDEVPTEHREDIARNAAYFAMGLNGG